MSDTLIGIVGKDYTLVASDASAGFSIILMKDNEDKIFELDENKLLAGNGETGDRVNFCEYIQKNLALYRFKNDRPLSAHGAASFLRGRLAHALRSSPYNANFLLAGFDKGFGPSLHYIDYLASCQKVEYGVQGYGSYFSYSILDAYYKKDMTLDEGIELLKKCIGEVQKRLMVNTPKFIVKVVDANGIRPIHL